MDTHIRSLWKALQSTARLRDVPVAGLSRRARIHFLPGGLIALLLALPGCHSTVSTAGALPKSTPLPAKTTSAVPPPKPSAPTPDINPALATYKPSAKLFVNGPTDQPRVALTFDAGADAAAVPLLLKTLADHHVHCTFFLTGKFCQHFPAQCKAIANAGMELGNHSYDHPMFTKRSDKQVCDEIEKAEAEIIKVCGRSPKPLFRFPYGDSDRRVRALVAKEGYQAIHWTLDSLDSVGKPKNADFVAKRIIAKIKPGSITLMHVSLVESAKSLPRIFDYLDQRGIQVVPVSQLLLSQQAEAGKKSTTP